MKRTQATTGPKEQRSLEWLTIGQLARLSGIKPKAIRYYESAGVLPKAERQENGYRHYDQTDLDRLILLRCLRRLGVPLESLKPLLHEPADAYCADIQQEVLRLIEERRKAIDQELKELSLLRETLTCNEEHLLACQPPRQKAFRECGVTCLPWKQVVSEDEGAFEEQNAP
jgi:DNA-binding transcriptional MerR regulator